MSGIYLCGAAILTAIFVALAIALPRRRPGAFAAAAALAPFGLLGYVFVPDYWRPDHLFQIVPGVGIEDFLICFSEGGIAWLLAGYGERRKDATAAKGSQAIASPRLVSCAVSFFRFALLMATGAGLSIAGRTVGLGTMTAIVVGYASVGVVVGALRRDLLPGALFAGGYFASLHVGTGVVVLAIWPDAASFWNPDVLAGMRTFGLPIEELLWALTFGACWPMFVQVAFFEPAATCYRLGGPDCLQSGSTKSTRGAAA